MPELRFQRTNINLCLFQQFSVLRSWWARVECTCNCGFTEVGPLPVVPWAVSHKHQSPPSCESCGLTPPRLGGPAAHSAQALLLSMQSRISTMQSMRWKRSKPGFGKMEYLVPSAALLTHLCAASQAGLQDLLCSDDAMKCGILRYSTRLFLGCAVTDTEASHFAVKTNQLPASLHEETLSPEEFLAKKVLLTCVRDPITMTGLSNHVTALRGAAKHAERLALFKFLHSKGLGSISETRRRGNGDGHCQAFHRCGLSPDAQRFLQRLQVLLSVWPTSFANADSLPALPKCHRGNALTPQLAAELPCVRGGGKRAQQEPARAAAPPPKTPSADQVTGKRAQYRRAQEACFKRC